MAGATWNCCRLGTFRTPHKVHACLAVTCHLHFWQNNRDLLCDTAVTWGWKRYNKSQHRKLWLFFQHWQTGEGYRGFHTQLQAPPPCQVVSGTTVWCCVDWWNREFHPRLSPTERLCTECRNAVPEVFGLCIVSYLCMDYFAVSTWERVYIWEEF